MSGLPRADQPQLKRSTTTSTMSATTSGSMRPPLSRPASMLARGRSATPAHNGRTSPAQSVASTRTIRSSPHAGIKRKAQDFEEDAHETNINVVVRCRGRNDREVRENSGVVVSTNGIKGSTVELSMGPSALGNKMYRFDKVFSPAADQTMIFDEVVAPTLDEVFGGFNCTIFAYGQTGTGKTYTMTGDISDILPLPDAAGIVPRVLYTLFNRIEAEETECVVKSSFIELYNEELRDLLSTDDTVKLKIFEDNSKKGHSTTLVQGMEECHLTSAAQGIQLLRAGSHKRQVASTKCNDLSSRSHTVFTITMYMKRAADDGQEYLSIGKLNLVDLAGSENIQRSGAENKRAAEAGLINKSLLTLGRVINALVEKSPRIPYRDSKLTRLLQDSLGGRTKTCIIATLSPAKSNLEETISTLDYAFRAKNIRNKPQVNALLSKNTLLREYLSEIEKLKGELTVTRQRNGVYMTQENYDQMTTVSESRRILSEEQRDKIETMEVNLRNKIEELFNLTANFQTLKKDNEQTRLTLEGTQGLLEKTEAVLDHTRQNLADETKLRQAHAKTEGELADIGYEMISTLGKTTSDIDGLHSKVRRKSELQLQNKERWATSQHQVAEATQSVDHLLAQLKMEQAQLMDSLSMRMQTVITDELDRVKASQSFLQEKVQSFTIAEKEVKTQTSQARDDLNEVFGEIKTLRADVKDKVGQGLSELSAAAEKISANIMTELDSFHTQLHASYSSLGREFKTTFDELVKGLNDQRHENSKLHEQVLAANKALLHASSESACQLSRIVEQEKEQSARDREVLLTKITSLLTASAEEQGNRLNDKVEVVRNALNEGHTEFEAKQSVYCDGISTWSNRSDDLIAGISASRDGVKQRLKADFAMATQYSTSIKDTTTAVHASTVKIVNAQMAQMDTQLHSLDDIMNRVREQNDAHHASHTTSLHGLSSNVQASYASFNDRIMNDMLRLHSCQDELSRQTDTLKQTLPRLGEAATIRTTMQGLRQAIGTQHILEYAPTGDTPQRVAYSIPEQLPRTGSSMDRGPNPQARTSARDSSRSPSKPLVFNDSPTTSSPTSKIFTGITKPDFARSLSAHTTTSIPLGASLRELDVNVIAQESMTQPLPVLSHSSNGLVMAAPPAKKARNHDDGTKIRPMKKMGRKTVGGEGKSDRENLTITNFSSSVGQGMAMGRRLRSQQSE